VLCVPARRQSTGQLFEVPLRDDLDTQPFHFAKIAAAKLPRKTHLLSEEHKRDQYVTRRYVETVGAQEVIVEPGPGISRFNLAKPSYAHAQSVREFPLGKAVPFSCFLNSPSRLFLHVR
jgi:hypothetical protein